MYLRMNERFLKVFFFGLVTENRRDGEQLGEDQAPADDGIRQESLAGATPQTIRNGMNFISLNISTLILGLLLSFFLSRWDVLLLLLFFKFLGCWKFGFCCLGLWCMDCDL